MKNFWLTNKDIGIAGFTLQDGHMILEMLSGNKYKISGYLGGVSWSTISVVNEKSNSKEITLVVSFASKLYHETNLINSKFWEPNCNIEGYRWEPYPLEVMNTLNERVKYGIV